MSYIQTPHHLSVHSTLFDDYVTSIILALVYSIMMNDEPTTNVFEQLRNLVPGVNQCTNELEFIQCVSNYILYLQSQLVRKQHNKRDILRTLDSNQQ